MVLYYYDTKFWRWFRFNGSELKVYRNEFSYEDFDKYSQDVYSFDGEHTNYIKDFMEDFLYDIENGRLVYINFLEKIEHSIIQLLSPDYEISYKRVDKYPSKPGTYHILKSKTSAGDITIYSIDICAFDGYKSRIISIDNLITISNAEMLYSSYGVEDPEQLLNCIYKTINLLNEHVGISETSPYRRYPTTISSCGRKIFKKTKDGKLLNFFRLRNNKKYEGTTYEEIENFVRKTYKSGFNCVPKKPYVNGGVILDVNSLFPYVASKIRIPVSFIKKIEGHKEIKEYLKSKSSLNYCFFKVKVKFSEKSNGVPFIPYTFTDKNELYIRRESDGNNNVLNKDYIKDTYNYNLTLYLTQTDLKLLFENYNVTELEFLECLVFATSVSFLKNYMERFYYAKEHSTGVNKLVNKMLLNSLIGTLGQKMSWENYKSESKKYVEVESKNGTLVHVASAILSAAREFIITDAKKAGEYFVYSDTDSLHLSCSKEKAMEIFGDRIGDAMGQYKIEYEYDECRYFSKKRYIMTINNELVVKAAGIPYDTSVLISKYYNMSKECSVYDTEKDKWVSLFGKINLKFLKIFSRKYTFFENLQEVDIPLILNDVDHFKFNKTIIFRKI